MNTKLATRWNWVILTKHYNWNIHEDDSSNDDEEEAILPIPTSAETSSAFDCLVRAFECNSDILHDYFKQLQEMKQFLATSQTSKLKQKQVTDFFSGKWFNDFRIINVNGYSEYNTCLLKYVRKHFSGK